MKHQYGDYIKWTDKELFEVGAKIENHSEVGNYWQVQELKKYRASLLANRDTLERHKWKLVREQLFPELPARIVCSSCESWQFGKLSVPFPCPAILDVTNQLDEVME